MVLLWVNFKVSAEKLCFTSRPPRTKLPEKQRFSYAHNVTLGAFFPNAKTDPKRSFEAPNVKNKQLLRKRKKNFAVWNKSQERKKSALRLQSQPGESLRKFTRKIKFSFFFFSSSFAPKNFPVERVIILPRQSFVSLAFQLVSRFV